MDTFLIPTSCTTLVTAFSLVSIKNVGGRNKHRMLLRLIFKLEGCVDISQFFRIFCYLITAFSNEKYESPSPVAAEEQIQKNRLVD